MIVLTGPDGQALKINPKAIVSLRAPRGTDHLNKDVHCLVFTSDGKYVGVQETCEQVNNKLP
jgi:uncharacterized protein YlzI (FlbEa/FlbD family)